MFFPTVKSPPFALIVVAERDNSRVAVMSLMLRDSFIILFFYLVIKVVIEHGSKTDSPIDEPTGLRFSPVTSDVRYNSHDVL